QPSRPIRRRRSSLVIIATHSATERIRQPCTMRTLRVHKPGSLALCLSPPANRRQSDRMIILIDTETAKLPQCELLHEAQLAQLVESIATRKPSLTSRLLRAVTRWLTRPVHVVDNDQTWPLLEQYSYGPRP